MQTVEQQGRRVLSGGAGGGTASRTTGVFNTDQGSQFTSQQFTGRLTAESIAINMDGKGRAIDKVMIERLWRPRKQQP